MAEGLKVLMMGGQRVGKSSALAAIMDAFMTGRSKEFFEAKDTTELGVINGESQASVASKLSSIKEMLSRHVGKTILVDSGRTINQWDYTLEFTLPNTSDSMQITFTDINGEYFEGGNQRQSSVIELVKEYDVFIIAVDTPFMMEARNPHSHLVSEVINIKYNCVESIHTFLSHINDDDGKDAKLVIFVPIKCECWAKRRELDSVTAAVREDYCTTISSLERYKSVQIEVLPIQTIGSAQFCKHMEAYIFDWKERYQLLFTKNMSQKCGMLPGDRVMLSDGTIKPTSIGCLREDGEAVMIVGTDIVRPNSWYEITSKEYAPHNCEQLAYHIFEFMLSKVIDARIRSSEQESGFIRTIRTATNFILNISTLGLWNRLLNIFGGITIEQMQAVMSSIRNSNLIKHTGDGIKIIKSCNFKN